MLFSEMEIDEKIKLSLKNMGFESPSKVQELVIPSMIKGNNVVVKSHTGSGKTAAFGIPVIDKILKGEIEKVLIVGPTRELVVQVCEEIRKISKDSHIKAFAVYGGHGIEGEIELLNRKFNIVCATPGRLLDHIERRTLHPKEFDTIILDEADRMLDMGFIDDIKKIMSMVQAKNTHLFSATLDSKIIGLIKRYIQEYDEIILNEEVIGVNIIEETIATPARWKVNKLLDFMKDKKDKKVLIFVSTKRYCETLAQKFYKNRFRVETIHGDLSQRKREIALSNFKKGEVNILIATDVAARGLQIDNVDYVINYDDPQDEDTYKHRVGRTGRMGKTGYAVNFEIDNTDLYL
jgi:ATP-dependent RNA helicase DeaD